MIKKNFLISALFLLMAGWSTAVAEDGSRLWLRFNNANTTATITGVKGTALTELQTYWQGGPVVLKRQKGIAKDGYTIKSQDDKTVITATSDAGLLYGAYHLLRLQQTGERFSGLDIKEEPFYDLRILNHWDNPNGTVERGFAGHSIFVNPDPERMKMYARANASVGINGTVLNNVNAKPEALTTESLEKAKAIADQLRPYGIRVYLSINFASPIKVGGLETADPLNAEVVKWWKNKVDEIYKLIPDFGGFLVKANSEGEPGPQDFGRTHADGANMLAGVLKPHKGIVMWRAFVYAPQSPDRANQAYLEFMPLDGQFADNVIIQIKNGPVDFQPREPYSPLFTAMQKTQMMVEFQITQEYLGAANHLVFLAPMWQEFFSFVKPGSLKAMAGVANIGDDTNWCGHHFAQSNWYAFGRLAWNPSLKSEDIADEWLQQTFAPPLSFKSLTNAINLSSAQYPAQYGYPWGILIDMMMSSREACVNYMMPLGIHHIFAGTHHYGPEPWYAPRGLRADWTPPYYHKADSIGLGFDRTLTGSANVKQYPEELCNLYNDINTCPENLLTWFHHVPWDHKMKSGRTFWNELCHKYNDGVYEARRFLTIWDAMQPYIDVQRFEEVQHKLRIQVRDSEWWRDACLLYFQTFSKRPIPSDVEHPVHNLDEMMKFRIPITMYENPESGYTK
ncbi:MAG: alpha-glucuronidase [Prevotella sp.]|nr:alpha-glucuronidase [Prevotella sp.]